MNENQVFHAYIVGGSRAEAKVWIDEALASWSIEKSGNADCYITEHVTFSIDDARELRSWQELTSMHGGRKVRVVYTDFMPREAENALLKTLEEPAAGTHIIFAVPNPEVLLPTLRSRARVIAPLRSAVKGNDAQHFLQLSCAERIAFIGKLVDKDTDDDAAARVRERTLALLNDLERVLSEAPKKNRDSLELLLQLKPYLYIAGGSSKMILETLAVTFPQF